MSPQPKPGAAHVNHAASCRFTEERSPAWRSVNRVIHAIWVFGSVTVLFPQLPSVWYIGLPERPYWSKTPRICVAFVTIEP